MYLKNADRCDPVSNHLRGTPYIKEYQRDIDHKFLRHYTIPREFSLVKHCQAKLGRQKMVVNHHRRLWVWEGDNWILWVSDVSGLRLEVLFESTPEEAIAVWRFIRDKLELTHDEVENGS